MNKVEIKGRTMKVEKKGNKEKGNTIDVGSKAEKMSSGKARRKEDGKRG